VSSNFAIVKTLCSASFSGAAGVDWLGDEGRLFVAVGDEDLTAA
jgi:hypothetical protein